MLFKCLLFGRVQQLSPTLEILLASVYCLTVVLLSRSGLRAGRLLAVLLTLPPALALAVASPLREELLQYTSLSLLVCPYLLGTALLCVHLWRAGSGWVLLTLLTGVLVTFNAQFLGNIRVEEGNDYAGVACYLADQLLPGDLVVASHPAVFYPLHYHTRRQFDTYQVLLPSFQEEPLASLRPGPPLVVDLASLGPTVRRLWLVSESRKTSPFVMPSHWRSIRHKEFSLAFFWQGEIQVNLWEAIPPLETELESPR